MYIGDQAEIFQFLRWNIRTQRNKQTLMEITSKTLFAPKRCKHKLNICMYVPFFHFHIKELFLEMYIVMYILKKSCLKWRNVNIEDQA